MRRACLLILTLLALSTAVHAQDDTDIGDYVGFVTAEVNNPTPYVGQPITYTFRFYDATTSNDIFYDPPRAAGMGQQNQTSHQDFTILEGIQYTVWTWDTFFFPAQTGQFIIESAIITFPETAEQRGGVLLAAPITIDVHPLPEGAPDGFNGAVGQFDLSVEVVQNTTHETGNAIELKATVIGAGNFEQLLAPTFALSEAIEVYHQAPVFEPNPNIPLLGSKTFTWSLVPVQSGSFQIGPVTLSFFDPQTESYHTLTSPTQTLDVQTNNRGDFVPVQIQSEDNTILFKPELRAINLAQTGPIRIQTPLFWLLWLVSPALVVFMVARRFQTQWAAKRNAVSRTDAYKQAISILKRAQRAREADTAFGWMQHALYTYFTVRLQLTTNQGIPVTAQLEQAFSSLPPELSEQLTHCLQQIEIARYAPHEEGSVNSIFKMTLDLLRQIDNHWMAS